MEEKAYKTLRPTADKHSIHLEALVMNNCNTCAVSIYFLSTYGLQPSS